MVVFGEALLPGYPFWPELTDGARFESAAQKALFAHYARQAVDLEQGQLNDLCRLAGNLGVAVYLGFIERSAQRGGYSLYASLAYINPQGRIASVHRKLVPTYEERLVWSAGDGHGLQVHPLKEFTVGGLNCWENWMPLARAALYGLGEDLHVAAWPGSIRNTADITRFIARESRSWVLSVSALMHADWILVLDHGRVIQQGTHDTLVAEIRKTLAANRMVDGVHIRLTLTRGVKVTSGMDPRINNAGPTLIVLAEHKPPVYDKAGLRLITSSVRRIPPECLDQNIHSCNMLNSILAKLQANQAGVDTIKELRNRNAENLAKAIQTINEVRRLARATPSVSMVSNWIDQAKKTDPKISY